MRGDTDAVYSETGGMAPGHSAPRVTTGCERVHSMIAGPVLELTTQPHRREELHQPRARVLLSIAARS